LNAAAIRSDVSGGIEGYALNLISALSRVPELDLVVFGSSRFLQSLRDISESTAGLESVCLPPTINTRPLRVGWEQLALPKHVANLSLDLVHSVTYVGPFLTKIPVIITIPDLLVYRYPECVPMAKRAYWKITIPLAVRSASGILAISEFTKAEIQSIFPGVSHKVAVSLLARDTRFDEAPMTATQPGVSSRSGFLCVGGLGVHKNTELVIRGLAEYRGRWGLPPNAKVQVVGRDYGSQNTLVALRNQLGLADEVEFLGQVQFAALGKLYSQSIGVIVPSRYEGFGLPALEAMSFGTPVVACRGGAVAEVVGDAGVLVDEGDAVGVATALRSLAESAQAVEYLGDLGRLRAGQYSWERTATETVRMYSRALGRCPEESSVRHPGTSTPRQ
jgi:glycosyltransferase involved in cell wall biosynthesis